MPPATATSMSPTRMPWSASITAFSPDPQTLLLVSAAPRSGRPPRSAAWRAGFCPSPAETTFPMMHSPMIPAPMPARLTASATASSRSSVALKPLSARRNFRVGVRTGLTITELRTAHLDLRHRVRTEEQLETFENHGRGAHDFTRPLRRRGFHEQRLPIELHVCRAAERGTDGRTPGEADFAVRDRRVAQ